MQKTGVRGSCRQLLGPAVMPREFEGGHYRVDGAVVGSDTLSPPAAGATTWAELRYVFDVLSECAAVVSYVASAEADHGFDASAAHYRRLWEKTAHPLDVLRRLTVGHEALPVSALDEVRIGVDRLAVALERIARRADVGKVLGVQGCTASSDGDTPVNWRLAHITAPGDTPSRTGAGTRS
jgi:hypothetical protein